MIVHGEYTMGAFAQVGVKMFTSPVTNEMCGSANQEMQTVTVSSTVVDEVQVMIVESLCSFTLIQGIPYSAILFWKSKYICCNA